MTLRLIDLFSGAGGMSLGFCDKQFCGGFTTVLALDNDAAAVKTHELNFPGRAVQANIEEWLLNNEVPQADVVIGGPPCQGFSLLNKKRDGDARRALWEPFIEIAERSGARVFVMENVAELYRSPERQLIEAKAAQHGFQTQAAILNAADYGAPQTRKRTIILGWREANNLPSFPPLASHADPKLKVNLPRWRTVRDVIGDLPAKTVGIEIGSRPTLNLHFGRTPTAKSLERYAAVPPGGNRFDLLTNRPDITPDCWVRKTSGGTDLFGRLWWDRPSVTIRTEFYKPEKGRYLHPEANRPISHREAARLMGFPDDFRFYGTKIEVARQIGNAVPPNLAGALARVVRTILKPQALAA
ncbi:DNA cytosine methyltransferase [uncultured Brevundimonas sp.]|uniref:DNA cytosine methyltransferase n=1 Tax=uncultured Brevundimonas sp. TaxID=213418 RepID=UPI0030EF811F|tara:strand:- start:7371 stop:8438 length:1068 start_codon:yes stop_codon:yes gene_type:complete